jgi:hypothetical protein
MKNGSILVVFFVSRRFDSPLIIVAVLIGVQRGVFKGIEDGRRPPTLRAGYP